MPSRPAARHALVCDGGSTTTMPRDPIRLSADGPRPRPMQGFRSAAGWRHSRKPGQAYPSCQTVRETGSTSTATAPPSAASNISLKCLPSGSVEQSCSEALESDLPVGLGCGQCRGPDRCRWAERRAWRMDIFSGMAHAAAEAALCARICFDFCSDSFLPPV